MKDEHSPLEQIVGEQLSSVTFVQDYLQLHFDGPRINVYNPLTVRSGVLSSKSWSNNFRNMLCEQITKKVNAVDVHDGIEFLITFEDSSSITISLKEADYQCAEAIYFNGSNNEMVVI